jgi:peptide/nickel transport system permease protein
MKSRSASLWALAALYLLALAVFITSPHNYSSQDREILFAGSSFDHLAGTDALGRDRAVRISIGLLLSLAGSAVASVISTAIAAVIGIGAAFVNRAASSALFFITDVFLALPWIFLLMLIRSAMPLNTSASDSALLTFIILAMLGWPVCARALYKSAVKLRNSDCVLHARATGLRLPQLVRYAIPLFKPFLIAQVLVCIPVFIMAEANLGSIGLGIGEPIPSWGGMLQDVVNSSVLVRSHLVLLPILVLSLVLLLLEGIAGDEATDA